jgi:hypothetical protein
MSTMEGSMSLLLFADGLATLNEKNMPARASTPFTILYAKPKLLQHSLRDVGLTPDSMHQKELRFRLVSSGSVSILLQE